MMTLKIKLTIACLLLCSAFTLHAAPPTTQPAIADRSVYLHDIVNLLQQKWPANRTVNIVCHGHSVPAGYANTPIVRTFDAYPMLLHEKLCAGFPYAVTNVIVTGIGGETSQAGAARFARDVLCHHPNVITIDYGLNDRYLGLAPSRQAWSSMIQASLAAGIKVILLTPTADIKAPLDDPNDPLNQQADQIRDLAAQYHVGLVDSLQLFKQYLHNGGKLADLMAQSNHPNRKGHELVAAELAAWFTAPVEKVK